MTGREPIFAALFTLASNAAAGTLRTQSRTLRAWVDVSPAEQPALFQAEGKSAAQVRTNQPTRWVHRAELVIYVHKSTCGQDDVVVALNNVIDAIVAALDRPAASDDVQTLGGLVTDCRIQGDIETSEGRLGELAVAIIPIEIIANA